MATQIIYVLDYPAMGKPNKKLERLHREDCIHADVNPKYREAKPQELETIPPCKTCQKREAAS